MSPVLKIFVGALMMVLGVFTSVTYLNQLSALILGGIGPVLLLIGAFIVWLESDEWKMQRKEQSQQKQQGNQFQGQQTLRDRENNQRSGMETETREAAQEIKQAVSREQGTTSEEELVSNNTVEEVKNALERRDDLDTREVLQAEKNNQNRKTLINYIERRLD